MYRSGQKNNHSHFRKRTIIIIAVVAALMLAVGGVFAKYIAKESGNNLLAAKVFYFTSDLLKEETAQYVLNSSATEVSFTLGNNADKIRYSEVDIDYTVEVTKTNEANPSPTIEYSNETKKLLGHAINTHTITLKNLIKGETYTVKATGKGGYEQVLSAEFRVSDNNENVYKNLDTTEDDYVLLTVWTENVTGKLTVAADKKGLIPDNTDMILREVYNYKDGKYGDIEFEDAENFEQTYSSYTYRFFVDSNSFTVEDFKASITNDGKIYNAVAADIP